jgi:hypothetical protein
VVGGVIGAKASIIKKILNKVNLFLKTSHLIATSDTQPKRSQTQAAANEGYALRHNSFKM